ASTSVSVNLTAPNLTPRSRRCPTPTRRRVPYLQQLRVNKVAGIIERPAARSCRTVSARGQIRPSSYLPCSDLLSSRHQLPTAVVGGATPGYSVQQWAADLITHVGSDPVHQELRTCPKVRPTKQSLMSPATMK